MNRVVVLIDGFNFYHSIRDIQNTLGVCYKWLDVYSLCNSFCQLIGRDARIEKVYYFTALATHLNNLEIIQRHKDYIRCLEETGISIEYGRFKRKDISCPACNTEFVRHEEKETDVRIATKVCHVFACNECDTIIIVS